MAHYRHKKSWPEARDVDIDIDVRPLIPDAENDSLNTIEIEKLESSAGNYERIFKIRERLHQSDVWIGIAMYAMLAGIAFVTF